MEEAVIGESRQAPGGGRMSVGQIEHELGKLRTNDDGTLALRSSVLNLIVVTDEESAQEITASVSKLAGRHPARAVVFIADPEGEPNVDVGLSAFCHARGGGSAQVCAEQVTIHAEGPPARHLESFAGPLLIPDLPVFLWYPGGFSPRSPEFAAMADLADRVIVDSAASENHEACLREIAALIEDPEMPAIGDLQWVGLSPWRSLLGRHLRRPRAGGRPRKDREGRDSLRAGRREQGTAPRRLARLHPGMEARERGTATARTSSSPVPRVGSPSCSPPIHPTPG